MIYSQMSFQEKENISTEWASALHRLTNNVPACCVKLPMSQCVGVALSPNFEINNKRVRSRPLRSQITAKWRPSRRNRVGHGTLSIQMIDKRRRQNNCEGEASGRPECLALTHLLPGFAQHSHCFLTEMQMTVAWSCFLCSITREVLAIVPNMWPCFLRETVPPEDNS